MDIQRFGRVLCVCLWFRCLCSYLMLMCPRNNDVEMHVTVEDTKRASVLLIRKLFLLMQNLNILPNNVYLTMKLYYYDDSECVGPQVLKLFSVRVNRSAPALQSPQLITNRQDSRRENVTVCGLRARQCTSGWARYRRPFIPWEFVCRQKKARWRSFRKEIVWLGQNRLSREILRQAK